MSFKPNLHVGIERLGKNTATSTTLSISAVHAPQTHGRPDPLAGYRKGDLERGSPTARSQLNSTQLGTGGSDRPLLDAGWSKPGFSFYADDGMLVSGGENWDRKLLKAYFILVVL